MPNFSFTAISGHAGRDAETRYTANQSVVANVSVAVSSGKDANEHTEWFRVVAFGSLGEELAKARKGDIVSVQGKMHTREWEAKDGTKQKTTELRADLVRVQEYKKKEQAPAVSAAASAAPASKAIADMESDIPW